MQHTNTRRGCTQKSNNAVVYKKGHSWGILSGIYDVLSCNEENTSYNNNTDAGDPRLQSSGMTALCNNGLTTRGFTLIELLVVVLIIGILSAVALPQYNKATKRAQGREVYAAVDALDKALTNHYLENGHYSLQVSSANASYQPWFDPLKIEDLSLNIPELKHFRYTTLESVYSNPNYVHSQTSREANPANLYQVIMVNKEGCEVAVEWANGRTKNMYCFPAKKCAQYFDGTVQQIGTSSTFIFN